MKNLPFLLLLVILAGCYPDGPKYTSELDLAATNYDGTFNFTSDPSSPLKYILLDTIFHGDNERDLTRDFDGDILARIESNMAMAGYERVNEDEIDWQLVPDSIHLVITVSAWSSTTVDYYGGYYPPYWGPGWGWYYPPGWGFVTTSTYGTTVIDMSDPKSYANDQVRIVWAGLVNGMLSNSSTSSLRSRINTQIDACFAHPPFNN